MARISALPGFARAVRHERELHRHERFDRARLDEHQRRALARIVAHARARSPFYRDLYAAHGVDEQTPLHALPPVDKSDLMERFDDWVTDPRVTLARAQHHLSSASQGLLGDKFVVASSGGSSRRPGVFVFDPNEWDVVSAIALRASRWCGFTPRLPRRRVAFIHAPGAQHMADRVSRTLELGIHRSQRLAATQPTDELVATLNEFQPTALVGYASVIALLAAQQIDGQLKIAPSGVLTDGEPRSAEITNRIRTAWGSEPFDLYAVTETGGGLALDCQAHDGRHVYEDTTIVEVVDADDRPVPDGNRGHHLLITNLFCRTQPYIRYRLSDMTAYHPGTCSCGLAFRRLEPIEGRHDDILELPGRAGTTVHLHPTVFAPLFTLDGVAELEVVQRGRQLQIAVVPRSSTDSDAVVGRVRQHAAATLERYGCDTQPQTLLVSHLTRHPIAGKIKLVRREIDQQQPGPGQQ
ncbi:MAG: phenylacetate--CoA ligase family protein [Solirubrobacterales bacterium]|nr:phenylacetate--CoA ligase family protein [Solirubrobacterales bacterium]MBV9916380.1 phenylacetate--CoA ligase family protein [Solirubrobacterales bacterium]